MNALRKMICMSSLTLAGVFIAHSENGNEEKGNAKTLLNKMSNTYAAIKSYQDTGYVKTVFYDTNGGKNTRKLIFSTSYDRPDRFRFEYGNKVADEVEGSYIIWKNKGEVKTWWELDKKQEAPESLYLAIAAATGVSSGSSHTIPRLLIPDEIKGYCITDMKDTALDEDAKLEDGTVCYRVTGKDPDDAPIILWIEKDSFLIRKIEEKHKFDDFRTEETTEYKPKINIEIPDDALKFNPPNKE